MVNVPVRLPATDGVKVTATVHDAPDASVEPHVLTWLKSPAVDTVSVMSSAPVFEMRTSCAGAVVDTVCEPNVTVAGKIAMADAGAAAETRTSVNPRTNADNAPAAAIAGRTRRPH